MRREDEQEKGAMMKCPDCKGKKESFGIGCGTDGCNPMILKCYRCNGTGEVLEAMKDWIETGKRLRHNRLARDFSLRNEAERLNMLPSEYSDIEQGRVDNSKFREAGR